MITRRSFIKALAAVVAVPGALFGMKVPKATGIPIYTHSNANQMTVTQAVWDKIKTHPLLIDADELNRRWVA